MKTKTKFGFIVFTISIIVLSIGFGLFAASTINMQDTFVQDYLIFITGFSFLIAVFSLPIFFMDTVRAKQ